MLLFTLLVGGALAQGPPAPITFYKDIAPIVAARCATCHQPGAIGPFSLLTYDDVRRRATLVATATAQRVMPPWMPSPGDHQFLDSRALTDTQIDLIQRWVSQGAPEGTPAEAAGSVHMPPARAWHLGTPDLVVTMSEPFNLPAGGPDLFRTFVIPLPVDRARFVRALEFRPGNPRVVHHVNMGVDVTPASRRLDALDAAPGYFGGILPAANYPPGQMLGWTPGQTPRPVPTGTQWRLDPGSDLVVQLHLQPGGKPESVQASVGLFFTDDPPTRTPVGIRLGSETIDVAAGVREHVIGDRYVLPVDVEAVAVQPHAHNLARQMDASVTLPDGTRQSLVVIRNWDFRWQEVYRFAKPIALPKGSTVSMRFIYDNSTDNPRNPHTPPRRVTWGQNTSDEMADLWLQVIPRTAADLTVLGADVGRKMHAEDIAAYTKLARENPASEELQNAVAVLYLQEGTAEKAMPFLRTSLQLNPRSAPARFNLGLALTGQRQFAEALVEFLEAARLDPSHGEAHYNAAAILRAQNRLNEAVSHYRQAVAARPEHAAAHADLAWILATADPAMRAPAEAVRLAEQAARLTGRGDAAILDTLAITYAAAGNLARAKDTAHEAAGVAAASGRADLADQIRKRAEAYAK